MINYKKEKYNKFFFLKNIYKEKLLNVCVCEIDLEIIINYIYQYNILIEKILCFYIKFEEMLKILNTSRRKIKVQI